MNKNSMRIARLNAKNAQTGKKVNSEFGAPGNLNRSRKNYSSVQSKSQRSG